MAALQATLDRLAAKYPSRPVVSPAPAPAPIDPAVTAARHALARAYSAMFDARAAKYALRDDYRPQPGRFTELAQLLATTAPLADLRDLAPAVRQFFPEPAYEVGCGGSHIWLHRADESQRLACIIDRHQ